jgi:hypothetical protein
MLIFDDGPIKPGEKGGAKIKQRGRGWSIRALIYGLYLSALLDPITPRTCWRTYQAVLSFNYRRYQYL